MEDKNDDDSMSSTKYNEHQRQARVCKEEAEQRVCEEVEYHQAEEQRRVEAEKRKAKEQAKRRVSYPWLIMTELMVLGGGGCCATAQQRQKEGVGATEVPMMPRPWA